MIARSYARIHWQNLANFGVLPLEFTDAADLAAIRAGDVLHLRDLHTTLPTSAGLTVTADRGDRSFSVTHHLSPRQVDTVLAGGRIAQLRR